MLEDVGSSGWTAGVGVDGQTACWETGVGQRMTEQLRQAMRASRLVLLVVQGVPSPGVSSLVPQEATPGGGFDGTFHG